MVAVEEKKLIGYLGVMDVMDELHVNTIGTLRATKERASPRR
ncbi:MAG TPA: hypothetical protein VIJ40_11385 [Acidimicrobiales bacterium]